MNMDLILLSVISRLLNAQTCNELIDFYSNDGCGNFPLARNTALSQQKALIFRGIENGKLPQSSLVAVA
jgi:phospholipase C